MLALSSGIIGVLAGAIVTLVGSYLQQRWSFARQLKERQEQARVDLVREIMRWRLDQNQLVLRLNELPLLFGHDAETMRLYRALISAKDGAEGSRVLGDLVTHVAKTVGLDGAYNHQTYRLDFTFRPLDKVKLAPPGYLGRANSFVGPLPQAQRRTARPWW